MFPPLSSCSIGQEENNLIFYLSFLQPAILSSEDLTFFLY